MNNSELIPFLMRCIMSGSLIPSETIIELTGGEPALYDGIEDLLDFLQEHSIKTLVKTNGMLKIEPRSNIVRCAAFHNLDNPPKYYDVILIIEGTPDYFDKFNYCLDNKIPFETIGKDHNNRLNDVHGFDLCSFINPAGHNCKCQDDKAVEFLSPNEKYDYGRIPFMHEINTRETCKNCKAATDAWTFLRFFKQ